MIFTETKLKGAFLIDLEKREDERGFFARTFCAKEFEAKGLNPRVVNANTSTNLKKGTLRGMHFQNPPHAEVKTIRCTRGAIYDVIVDLRKDSATYKQWIGVELTEKNYRTLYIPEGFAHGFYTLEDGSEVMYFVSQFYVPGSEGGLLYKDPQFSIQWPGEPKVISEKDAAWPPYKG